MNFISNPRWINAELQSYNRLKDVPPHLFDEINQRLSKMTSAEPFVSVVIPAFNEEVNVVRCIDSLSKNITSFKTEIIIVDNNSTDSTREALGKLNVRSLFQPIQGCGPARQLGQEHAGGKYILMADADCLYPPRWIEKMTKSLMSAGVVCVYGAYSFMGTATVPRWKLSLYESARNVMKALRHVNRPHINALGMSMGYLKELGLKVGFIQKNIRGEDGRFCFELHQIGKVKHVDDTDALVWTSPRTLEKEGRLLKAFSVRVLLELTRLHHYLFPQAPHDVTKGKNYNPGIVKFFRKETQKQVSEQKH
jgi:glycosyltransferase involved in cell wall biosynthesis